MVSLIVFLFDLLSAAAD